MALNKNSKAKIAEMDVKYAEAIRHAEAAEACAIGYKEAGSPPVYIEAWDKYIRIVDEVIVEVPASWYYAFRSRQALEDLNHSYKLYAFRRGSGEYYEAQKKETDFRNYHWSVLYYAEKSVEAS